MSHAKKRTPRSSIAPPIRPKHRSLANEELEAFSRFWHSQKALPVAQIRVETSIYVRSKSSPGSAPNTPILGPTERSRQIQRLLQLLTAQRVTAIDSVSETKSSIRTPMTRIGAAAIPQWGEEVPATFGPAPKPQACGYYGKRYKAMSLRESLEILVLKKDLDTQTSA
jgi:hypothetical protein